MASQMRVPSTDQFLYLLNEFPGLQFHRQDLALPFNRFELELVEPGSRLNAEICSTYCIQSGSAQLPQFTYVQLVTLALLSSPVRTLSVREILRWLCASFPGIRARQIEEHARGVTPAEDCVMTLSKRISEYCNLSETNWQCDLIATGEFEVPHTEGQYFNLPGASKRSYRLPWGVEDEKFAPMFNMMHLHGGFGITPPAPPLWLQAQQHTLLMDLPNKIKLRILSNLLTFPNPVSVHWNQSRRGPIVAVFIPPALRTNKSRPVRSLWVSTNLLNVFQVCKEFEELGRFAFYSMNTFLVDTKIQPEHPEILRSFLSRIGPKSRQLIRSVQFNINMLHQTDKLIKDSIAKLGESYCLQFITLDIHTPTLPKKARDDPAHIVGLTDPAQRLQSILRFKGLRHITIFNHSTAQVYADVCLEPPWAMKEAEIMDQRIESAAMQEEEEKQRPTMTEEELGEMLHARKRRNINITDHERQLKTRKGLEKTWTGAAGMTVHFRSRNPVQPVLDEKILIQRPGLGEGYLGADPRVKGPGVGYGKVYDLDVVWGDKDMRRNVQRILRVMRPEMSFEVSTPEILEQPKRKKQRIATPTSITLIAPIPTPSPVFHNLPKGKAMRASLPTVAEASRKTQVFSFDMDNVDKHVDEVLALEAKYKQTMQSDEAKKAALRAVFSKVMHMGVDVD